MKKFKLVYDVLIFIVFMLGIIKLVQNEYFLGITWMIITPLLMLLPRNLYKLKKIKENYQYNIVLFFEVSILILVVTSVGHTLYFKNINIDFDSFSHFINLLIYTVLFGIIYFITRYKGYSNANKNEVAIVSLIILLIFGVILWEKFQFYGDKIFNTHMFYDNFQNSKYDSKLDQIFGAIGVLVGSFVLYKGINSWMKSWRK